MEGNACISFVLFYRILNSVMVTLFLSAGVFRRAIIMPNLKPPMTNLLAALAYRDRIMKALPSNVEFEPLMTLYLIDVTSRKDIKDASKCHRFLIFS